MTAANLKIIPREPSLEQEPNLDYEWQERQRIRSRDWAAVHIAADKREPVVIADVRKVRRG